MSKDCGAFADLPALVGTHIAEIAQDFAGSQEFLITYGALTTAEYVDPLYLNVLGRPADFVKVVRSESSVD